MANWAYKRRGGPLVKWTGASPAGSRAAETRGLGGTLYERTAGVGKRAIRQADMALGCWDGCGGQCKDSPLIPKPGAPEIVGMGNYVAVAGPTSAIESIDDAIHTGAGRSVAMAANAFHGYRRNGSIAWALAWGVLGYAAPVITTVIATAQGFGHKKGH